VQKGKVAALREMTGDTSFLEYKNIINSERQSASAKKRAGTEGLLKTAIRKSECKNLDDLLDYLEDSEIIENLFFNANPEDRIDIHEIEVYRDEKYISYSNRKGKDKTATFKTLKTHLSDINK